MTYEEHDGDVYVPFAEGDRRFLVSCHVGGTPQQGLTVSGSAAEPVPRDAWPVTLVACNNWNTVTPAVKAHLFVEDWATSPDARLFVQSWMPLPATQPPPADQVAAVVETMLAACVLFWFPDRLTGAAGQPAP